MSDRANNKPEEGDNQEDFKLKILGPDGNAIYFGILKGTAEKLKVPRGSLRFLLEGKRINDDKTPEQMKGNDVIEHYSGQSSSSNQSEIQRILECIICQDPCASPIYNCLDNGHIVCGFCYDKLKTTAVICPFCQCKTLQPSPLAERQSRQNDMEGNCPFAGCSDRVLAAEMMTHVKNCEYREIQCTRHRFGYLIGHCNKMFPLGEFPRHATNVHITRVMTESIINENGSFPGFTILEPLRAGNEKSEKYWGQAPSDQFGQKIYKYDEHFFGVHEAVGNYQFFWWVTIFGGQKEANRYNYETELVWKNTDEQKHTNATAVQTLPVLPYNRYEKYDKFCGNYAMVHAATATAYSQKVFATTDIRRLTVRIKIFKTNKGTKRTADATVESASKRSK